MDCEVGATGFPVVYRLPGHFTDQEGRNHEISVCVGNRVTLGPNTQNSIDGYYDAVTHGVSRCPASGLATKSIFYSSFFS